MKYRKRIQAILPALLLSFLIGSHNGRLAVWKDDDPQPFRVFPCPTYLLPRKDRDALERGILIKDMEDVANFLENFLT